MSRFWGRAGAGILFVCESDETLMLVLRSQDVEQPGTWGIPGGACGEDGFFDEGERSDISEEEAWRCAVKETKEELQYFPKKWKVTGIVEYRKEDFVYRTFIVNVSAAEKKNLSRKSRLNWENDALEWRKLSAVNPDDADLHFGVRHVLRETR